MSELSRRAFVHAVAALVPVAAALPTGSRGWAVAPDRSGVLDERLLRALADAVLPSELGREGTARVAHAFGQWLAGYRPDAELDHGYGTGELERLPADPGPAWAAQLEALQRTARERFGAPFARLAPGERRGLVGEALAGERLDRVPRTPEARHVAVALLAYFYNTAEATDLCYRAAIRRNACRPLARAPERPAPLAGGR